MSGIWIWVGALLLYGAGVLAAGTYAVNSTICVIFTAPICHVSMRAPPPRNSTSVAD